MKRRERVRIVGLPDPAASRLVAVLSENGFEVVAGAERNGDATIERADLITPRQIEILAAIRDCGSSQRAAEALSLSVRTVNAHLRHIYTRIEVHGRLDAICWACRRGLLDPAGGNACDSRN